MEIIITSIITWIFAHVYYKAGKKQDEDFRNKLSKDVKGIILDSNKEKLSVIELNKLLEEKIYKSEGNDPLPFQVCPNCGSENLIRRNAMNDESIIYSIKCDDCDWSDWTE